MSEPLKNARRELFAQAVAAGTSVLASHKAAGYRVEPRNAARLRAHPSIRARIEQIQCDRQRLDQVAGQRAIERLSLSKERTANEFAAVGFANMMDYTVPDADGHRVLDLDHVTRDQMAAVQEMTVNYYTEGKGNNALRVKRVKVKLHPKVAALEKLARMFGWIVDGRYLQQDDELVKLTARLAAMTPEQRREGAEDLIRRARERLAEAKTDELPLIDNQTGEAIKEE